MLVFARFMFTLVLAASVASPIATQAHICGPRFGCGNVQPPKLTKTLAIQIVQGYVTRNPPVVALVLRQPVEDYPSAAYEDLLRAGLLGIVNSEPGSDPGPEYDLTVQGLHALAAGFFRKPYENLAEIPVGELRYVPGSVVLHQQAGLPPTITFTYIFRRNANAAQLLRLGSARDWTIAHYANPYLDLSRLVPRGKQTLSLRQCHGAWRVIELPPYSSACP